MSEKYSEASEKDPITSDLQWEIDSGSLIASNTKEAAELIFPHLGISRMVERAVVLANVFNEAGLEELSVSLQPSMSIKVAQTVAALEDAGISVGSFDAPEKRNPFEFLKTAKPATLPEHIAYQLGFCIPTQFHWNRVMQNVLEVGYATTNSPVIIRTPSTFWNSNERMGDALIAAIDKSGMNIAHQVQIAIELNPWDDGLTFNQYVNKIYAVAARLKDKNIKVGMSFDTGHVEQVLHEQTDDPEVTSNAVSAFYNVAQLHGGILYMVELDQVRRENGMYQQHVPFTQGDVPLDDIMYEFGRLRRKESAGIPVAHAVIETDPRSYKLFIDSDSSEIRFLKTLQANYLTARY